MSDDVQVERTIAAEPKAVWAMVSDVTRMGEWSPETTGCEWVGDATGPVVGARFKGRNQKGFRHWSTICTVAEAEPGASFVFDVKSGPLDVARWAYKFEATDGGCRVTETWTDRRKKIFELISRPIMGINDRPGHNRAGMETTLERLATAAEAPAG
jgi:uncharacterized protein YndB with AHSA1/START domain